MALDLVVITGTHADNVDGQLEARPAGPDGSTSASTVAPRCTRHDEEGIELIVRREATTREDAALDRAAAMTLASSTAAGWPRRSCRNG